jgi:hypothetical protein
MKGLSKLSTEVIYSWPTFKVVYGFPVCSPCSECERKWTWLDEWSTLENKMVSIMGRYMYKVHTCICVCFRIYIICVTGSVSFNCAIDLLFNISDVCMYCLPELVGLLYVFMLSWAENSSELSWSSVVYVKFIRWCVFR